MNNIRQFATLLGLSAALGWSQSNQELINDGKNTDNVLAQSMGYDRKSYSPLNQINKSNLKRLVPVLSELAQSGVGVLLIEQFALLLDTIIV